MNVTPKNSHRVTLEIARRLKDAGFRTTCDAVYKWFPHRKKIEFLKTGFFERNIKSYPKMLDRSAVVATAPTIAQVKDWLRKRFDVIINTEVVIHGDTIYYVPLCYYKRSNDDNYQVVRLVQTKSEYDAYMLVIDYAVSTAIKF